MNPRKQTHLLVHAVSVIHWNPTS